MAKQVSGNVKKAKAAAQSAAPSDPFAYVAPALGHPANFTVWTEAFAGVEAIIRARKADAKAKADAAGEDKAVDETRAGFNRDLWIDAEQRDGHPVIVVRSKDHTIRGGRTDAPERAAMVYNDLNGGHRAIEVAHFPKSDSAGATKVAGEVMNFYRLGDADNRLTPLADRFAVVKDPRSWQVIALLSSHFDSPQQVGHFANRAAAKAKRSTKTATKGIAAVKQIVADDNDAELKAALALVEARLAGKTAPAAAVK